MAAKRKPVRKPVESKAEQMQDMREQKKMPKNKAAMQRKMGKGY